MINRIEINENTIQFEDFAASSAGNKIGDHVEVPMGGPWTAKRFVVSARTRKVGDPAKIVLTARAIVSHGMLSLDPVAGTVKRCGAVVGHYVHDEVCNLHYVGANLDTLSAPAACADTCEAALQKWAAGDLT